MAGFIASLTTARLLLRPFTAADAADVERLAGVWEIADTTLSIPHPYPKGAAAQWIETHAPAWTAATSLTVAIALQTTPDAILGAVSLTLKRAKPKVFREDLTTLFDLLRQKKIKPLIARTFPLAQARQAHELLGSGGVTGKLVLVTQPVVA